MSSPRRAVQSPFSRKYFVIRDKERSPFRKLNHDSSGVRNDREVVAARNTSPNYRPLDDFVENTSLLGVQHILRKKSVIWLVAYVICVSMSIAQSWTVTITFFEQKTYHSVTVISNNSMQFPSVTVCTNTVLQEGFNLSRIPGFNVSVQAELLKIDDCAKRNNMMKTWSKAVKDNKRAVVQYLRQLTDKERMDLAINITKYVKKCTFKGPSCNFSDPAEIHLFNNPYYGNCFTFNPAFEETSAKFIDLQDRLKMVFQLEDKGYWLVPRTRAKAAIHIHPPGTAPLVELPEVEDVFGGQSVELLVSLRERVGVKKRSKSIPSCVDSHDEKYRKRSRYFSAQSPYRYSLEACMKSCEQDYVGKSCGTINRFLPVQSPTYEANHHATLNPPCDFKERFNMESCNCPIACKEIQYQIVRDDNELSNMPCNGEKESLETSPIYENNPNPNLEDDTTDYKHEAVVTVMFRSNVYEHVEELLSCGLSEYLGILGGNMSLWIGLCILSLLEVVELFIKLIAVAVRSPTKTRQCKTSQSVNKTQKDPHCPRRRF